MIVFKKIIKKMKKRLENIKKRLSLSKLRTAVDMSNKSNARKEKRKRISS